MCLRRPDDVHDPEVGVSVIANRNESPAADTLQSGRPRKAARSHLCSWLSTAIFVLAVAAGRAAGQEVAPAPDDAVPEHVLAEKARLYGLAFDHWIAQTIRLQGVAQLLQLAGRDACGRGVSPVLGTVALRVDDVPEVFESVAKERFGEGEGNHVIAVFPGMAADRAGLEIGDTVLETDDSRGREHLSLEIDRAGERLTVKVESLLGCADPVQLVIQEEVNAFANGKSVTVTTALMRAIPDDAMLAQIVGHELGHNIYRDGKRRLYGSSQHRRREAVADYVGVYLAAMAGYPIATDTEKLLGQQHEIQYFGARGSHPMTAARDLALRKTLEEIRGKQERGEVIDLSSR